MNRKRSNYTIAVLSMMIIFMSIGFAVTSYTQLLEISGSNVVAKSASWNVHFDQNSYTETTGSIVGSHTLSNTSFTYDIELSPNEFYSAEFDVVNDGTFDAQLESITMTPTLTTNELTYIDYYIVYDGVTYTESQLFNNGPILASNGTKHLKVYIKYFTNETNSETLPEQDHEMSLSISFNYKQV